MKNEIMVSVQCITYNHAKYIKKALDGFVMQKTNFKFEVIVHDDASTDGTAQIIKEYAEKYDFIIPILQKENQYSQNIPFIINYIEPIIKGKYIAFCEGDDYWTDPNKLQTLYDYMVSHNECAMCCHAYENIKGNTEEIIDEVHTLLTDGTISIEKAISYKKPTQLASQMFRRDCVIDKPAIFLNRGVGDYTVLLYAATLGELHYIDKVMARHRIAADGSWTNRVYKNKELRIVHDKKMISFLQDFNNYTEKKYCKSIEDRIEEYRFDILKVNNDYKGQIFHSKFRFMSMKRKVLTIVGVFFPKFANYIINKHDFMIVLEDR